jgi:predicted dehydrogenase
MYDIGFLGYRFMGEAHANALDSLPMFFPEAPETNRHTLIGRDEDALEEAADRLGFDEIATDWEEALDDIDILYNLGPNSLHADPSIQALEEDIHVMCEKPLARSYEEAERMQEAAEESDAIAAVGLNYRYVPAIQKAKQMIEDGEIGEIHHVRGSYLQDWLADPDAPWSWRNDEEMAGSGALGDLGAHTFDLARYLVGDIESISGRTRTYTDERPLQDSDETRDVTVDDAYVAIADFENGATGTFEASRVAPGHKNDHTTEINGSEGSLRFSLERLNELEYLDDDSRGYQTISVTDEDDPYGEHWWPPGHNLGWEHTFIHENNEFLKAIDDDSDYEPSFADGATVQAYLDAVATSSQTGEREDVGAY